MDRKEITGMIAVFLVAGILLFVLLRWPVWSELSRCDAAIKDQLKAPATYNRVSPTWWNATSSVTHIEYDAQNGFGVPVRGRGTCIAGESSATWLEMD